MTAQNSQGTIRMPQQFPAVNDFGDFSIVATLSAKTPVDVSGLEVWLVDWIDSNNPWIREWSSGRTETIDFFDEFTTSPKVFSQSESRFALNLSGKLVNNQWKDWFTRIVNAIREYLNVEISVHSCIDNRETSSD